MKLVEDLIVSSAAAVYSPPVTLGENNCAMYEVWVTSIHAMGVGAGIVASLEGSNDGYTWTAITNPGPSAAITAAPTYLQEQPDHTSGTVILSWSMLRLKFTVGSNNALLSASVRPFRSA